MRQSHKDSSSSLPILPQGSTYHPTRSSWRTWLFQQHTRTDGVWLVYDKQSSPRSRKLPENERLTSATSVEEALCFGWIDSKPRKLDETRTMLWFAPRKAHTGWSAVNKGRIERMVAEGKMEAAGLSKIETAKADGTWEMLDAVEKLEMPSDLRREFERYDNVKVQEEDAEDSSKRKDRARQNWDAFPRSAKRGILEWILQAKRPETRAKRIAETVRLAGRNERANQWERKSK